LYFDDKFKIYLGRSLARSLAVLLPPLSLWRSHGQSVCITKIVVYFVAGAVETFNKLYNKMKNDLGSSS